jgi:hypothetical protein
MGPVSEIGVKMLFKYAIVFSFVALSACGFPSSSEAEPETLYRNSQVDGSMRIHVATFDAENSNLHYNLLNCQMTSKVLNANVEKLNPERKRQRVGFWCEKGTFEEEGQAVTAFDAEFPATTER